MRHDDGTTIAMGAVALLAGVAALAERGSATRSGAVGVELRQLLRTGEAFAILDADPDLYGTEWGMGGCGVLARALMMIFGDQVQPYAISTAHWPGVTQHFVVRYGDRYLDSDGSSTREALLRRFKREHGDRGRQSLTPVINMAASAATGQVLCPVGAISQLAAYLGPPLRAAAGQAGSSNKGTQFVVRSPAEGRKLIASKVYTDNWNKALGVKPKHRVAVLLPCAGTKPFSESPSHKHGYMPALEGLAVDRYIVAEPLGVVPWAWENTWPNNAYDFPPDKLQGGAWDLLVDRVRAWFTRGPGKRYDKILLALPRHHGGLVKAATVGLDLPTVDLSIHACRLEEACSDKTFRATTGDYQAYLRKAVQAQLRKGSSNRPARTTDPDEIARRVRAFLQPKADDWNFKGRLYGDAGPVEERRAEREVGRAAGRTVLGMGSSRVVFALPGSRVLKVAYWNGRESNLNEAGLWRIVSTHPELADVAECLAPVLDQADDGSWLIMARYNPGAGKDLNHRCRAVRKEFGIRDYTMSNLGSRPGDTHAKIIDYGFLNPHTLRAGLRGRGVQRGSLSVITDQGFHRTASARQGPSRPLQLWGGVGLVKGRVLDFGSGRGGDCTSRAIVCHDPNHTALAAFRRTGSS